MRNWTAEPPARILVPYAQDCSILEEESLDLHALNYLLPFKPLLENRHSFANKTFKELGRTWYEFERMNANKYSTPRFISFSHIATHGHFVFINEKRIFGRHPQVIKLPPALSPDEHLLLTGTLNASAVLLWLKQVCFSKRESDEGATDTYFEFAGGKVQQLPIPDLITAAIVGKSNTLADAMTQLSRECWQHGNTLPTLALKKLFEKKYEAYHDWNSQLPGYVQPHADIAQPFSSADDLRESLARAIEIRDTLRGQMIARQEEMDWLAYEAYGLIDVAQAAGLRELATAALGDFAGANGDRINRLRALRLQREQRPFCLWAAADGDFNRAVELIPNDWSDERKELWKARLQLIRDNEHIRRIEQPVYKRRWDEQWKVGARWQCGQPAYDQEFIDAFTWWLSEKAEWWLEKKSVDGHAALVQWTNELWKDSRVQAAWQVAADAIHRLELWKRDQKAKATVPLPLLDASPAAFARFFKATVKEQAVPEGIPYAVPYDKIRVNVPAQVNKIRGKLNVPRERFRVNEEGVFRVASFEELDSGGDRAAERPFA